MHLFIEEGLEGLFDKRSENGNRKVLPEHWEFIELASEETPLEFGFHRATWTLELFRKLLVKKFSLQISESTMSRLLNILRIKRKYPKPYLKCPWSKRRKNQRLREIEAMIESAGDGDVVLYVDEVDIHLNPKIGKDWMPCGVQKKVLTPGQNKKHYLAGALNHRTGQLTFVESDRKDSYLFIDQLWTLVQRDYPHATHIHLILDNYSIHHSNLTQIAIDALSDKLTLHFLPPYCPDDNRIERTWKDLHDNVTRNHPWTTMQQLMKAVKRYIRTRNKQAELKLAI
jgi:transposase